MYEPRTSRCTSWVSKWQRNQRSNCQHSLDHYESKEFPEKKTSTSASIDCDKPLTVWITTNWRILKDMGVPDHLICLVRNLYVGQEGTVRTGHETTDWFKMGKEYNKVVYCHLVHLTYLQRTSCKIPGWMNHKVESKLL